MPRPVIENANQHHLSGLWVGNYKNKFCYPQFTPFGLHSEWKRKIHDVRTIVKPDGGYYHEVKVWRMFWFQWVDVSDILLVVMQ